MGALPAVTDNASTVETQSLLHMDLYQAKFNNGKQHVERNAGAYIRPYYHPRLPPSRELSPKNEKFWS